ncbi:MAG: tRNA (cytidine(56)-2'-O)-methyltransferase [Candidatus Thermoplasmatota archaeon]|nr:tRNA (cytidine(56)-2'-O)-methyltransferase [Candidatus Thermoplasmatota archaeon]MBS3802462.1 tRNA (cytidine(56)-2'-O)-methyltransferase [Candidatus Thermoplasmatota archaeon]
MISVLRIGHRPYRDKRITTHVALVARAFGADSIFIDTHDDKIEETVHSVCNRFGGNFSIQTGVSPMKIIKKWEGSIVHLTMYGETVKESLKVLDTKKDLLLIVGAEKVPPQFYDIADINVAVGNQPHSEVAAVAIFLDRFTNQSWEHDQFDGEMTIIPSKHGKKVISTDDNKK